MTRTDSEWTRPVRPHLKAGNVFSVRSYSFLPLNYFTEKPLSKTMLWRGKTRSRRPAARDRNDKSAASEPQRNEKRHLSNEARAAASCATDDRDAQKSTNTIIPRNWHAFKDSSTLITRRPKSLRDGHETARTETLPQPNNTSHLFCWCTYSIQDERN